MNESVDRMSHHHSMHAVISITLKNNRDTQQYSNIRITIVLDQRTLSGLGGLSFIQRLERLGLFSETKKKSGKPGQATTCSRRPAPPAKARKVTVRAQLYDQ
jgi:hypothetical protein